MIVVSGNKRSGTSLWMQIFHAGGFDYIGEQFMKNWEKSIKDANPQGFFESPFRTGIHPGNNPNLKTGEYFRPMDYLYHVVKIFPLGVLQTEQIYLHRVLATIRHWKEYCHSIEKLNQLEVQFFSENEVEQISREKVLRRLQNPIVHPALLWWENNYILLRNAYTRKYPFQCIAYDKLLSQPEDSISQIFQWCIHPQKDDLLPIYMRGKHPTVEQLIDRINLKAAISVIDPNLHRQKVEHLPDVDFPLADQVRPIFDELYACFAEGDSVITPAFLKEMNRCHRIVEPYIQQQKERHRASQPT